MSNDLFQIILINLFNKIVDLPHIAYVHIKVNASEIPIQAARRNDDTFLLKFRPTIAGEYSIILKDSIEQAIPGKTK